MNLLQRIGFSSLRSKLVVSSLLVQVVMLAALVWNSVRITDNALHEVFQKHVDSMVTLMAVSLANPLVQRDYATLDERLERFLQHDSLVYLAVHDEMGRVLAQRGEVPKKERLDRSFDLPDKIYGQEFDITVANRVIGHAFYGLDVSLLKVTLGNLRTQGITVALLAILLTYLLLATIVHLVTHRLRALALAAHEISGGDYSVRVAVAGRDEVAVTAQTFNSMAATLEHDINQRRQAEQRLRNIIDGLGPNMFVGLLSTDGAVLEANQQALAAAGLKPEDVLGKPIEETYWFAYSEEIKQQMRQAVVHAAQGAASRFDVQIRATENQLIPLDFSLQPFFDAADKVVLLVTSAIVITERKLAEEALRQSENHFRTLFEQAPDGIFISDAQGKFLDVNVAGCKQLAYTRGELLKLNITDILAAEDVPRLATEMARLKDGNVAHSEWLFRRRNGSVFPGEVSAKQLPNGRLQVFLHDITARKRAESTMQADSRQLQTLSKRVLEAQEAERRHVARELHDELGQILTAIKINLQARNRLTGQSPVEIDSANIAMVEQAIDQVRRLALALRPSMLDDLGLMAALRWAGEQTLGRAGVTVQWQGDITDQRLTPEVETACYRIAQEAFTNIARHAQAKSVTITLRSEGTTLLLMVQDDGHGFDLAEKRARALSGGSVGVLGMQERATLSGGQLEIESVPGQGTIIRARFPWRARH